MQAALQQFNTENFYSALCNFFTQINIPVDYLAEEPARPVDILTNTYKVDHPAFQLMDDVYFLGMVDDETFEGNTGLDPARIESDYDGILLFGVTLRSRENSLLPTRTQLAEITRALNREFHYTPVVVIFKYEELRGQVLKHKTCCFMPDIKASLLEKFICHLSGPLPPEESQLLFHEVHCEKGNWLPAALFSGQSEIEDDCFIHGNDVRENDLNSYKKRTVRPLKKHYRLQCH